jgi:hypothetical protein
MFKTNEPMPTLARECWWNFRDVKAERLFQPRQFGLMGTEPAGHCA